MQVQSCKGNWGHPVPMAFSPHDWILCPQVLCKICHANASVYLRSMILSQQGISAEWSVTSPPPLPATQSVKELNWNVCETLIDGCIICDVLKQEYHARHNNLQWCLSCNQGKLKRATQTLLTTTVPGSHYCGMQVLITWVNQKPVSYTHLTLPTKLSV